MTLLFDRFVVDKTHRILIFDHSFDELPFSKTLCREGGREKHGTMGRKGLVQHGAWGGDENDSCL